jgi:hypothetical protein
MMGKFSHEELLEAFQHYRKSRDRASQTGDWNLWAELFTEDAHYIEHAYGELQGREAIRKWICGVMAPFPTMTFPEGWSVIDEKNGAVVWEVWNNLPEPFRPDGTPFGFPNWSRLIYGGDGLWQSEEDIYNPQKDAPEVFRGWISAGGKFKTPEQVKMKH